MDTLIEILQNPIVIGIIMGSLTYLFMIWDNSRKPENEREEISIYTPIIMAVAACVISYGVQMYLSGDKKINISENIKEIAQDVLVMQPPSNIQNTNTASNSSVASYQLIGKGVGLPDNIDLPDVFIDMI